MGLGHEAATEAPVGAAPGRSLRDRLLTSLLRTKIGVPIAVGLAAFGLGAAALAWANHDRAVLRVQVAFDAHACCTWQIWPDGIVKGSLTLVGVNAGRTQIVSAPINTPLVDQLYITTGSQPHGSARIERIWVQRGGRVVDVLPAAQLKSATVYDAITRKTQAGLVLTSTGSHPAIALPVRLETHEGRVRLALAHLVSQRLITLGVLLVFGAALLVFVAARRRAWPLVAGVAATAVLVRGAPWVSWHVHLHDDVTRAVGYASYVGLWKARERAILDMAVLFPVLVAAATALVLRRRRRSTAASATIAPSSDLGCMARWVAPLTVAAPTLVVALAALPNLRSYIGPATQHEPSWDANNLIFWQYLVRMTRLEPVKDFFWLYGFQWLTDERAPWGNLITYFWFLTFWVFIAVGSWLTLSRFFAGRSLVLRYLLLAALWVTAELIGDMPFTTRYMAAAATLLMFTGIRGASSWWNWARVAFAVAFVDAALFEPAQALYALGGIVFFAVAELAVDIRHQWRPWLARTAVTLVVPILIATVVFAVTGTLAATVALYRALFISSAAYAFPSAIDTWVTAPRSLEGAIFWALPLTLAIGLVGLIVARGRLRLSYGVVGAFGVLSLMIMQKQVLRPHAATQIWLPLLFGLAFWAVSDSLLAPTRRWSYVLALAGFAGALALVSGGYRQGWDEVSGGPSRLSGSVDALLHDRAVFAEQAPGQFAPSTFALYTDVLPVVDALKALPRRQRERLWTLSDDPEIPMMLGQGWGYYFNDLYDAAPIDFEQKVVRQLVRRPPATVVWNFSPHVMTFDAVPEPVRAPIVYAWSVQHLVPQRRIGQFEILRQRKPAEPVPLAWWRRRIGVREDLGRIPAVTKLPSTRCVAGRDCVPFLVVRFPNGVPHLPQVVVPVTVNGLRFEVAFEGGPESQYVVPLDRLWFVGGMPGSSLHVDTAAIGGAIVTVERRRRGANVLY